MRVQRTIAFVDLCRFTAHSVENGDAAAAETLGDFRALTREVASRRSIRVAKWLGDGAMLVSQDATAAIAGALELQRRARDVRGGLALRGGIAQGPVMLFEGDDYLGVAVNLAARLCDHARPHEVLCSPDLVEHVPAWASARNGRSRRLKGFTSTQPTAVLTTQDAPPDALRDPVCGLRLSPDHASKVRRSRRGGRVGFCGASCETAWTDARSPLPRAI